MRRSITKLYAEHVRKYVRIKAKKDYYKTDKGKISRAKDAAKYHTKKKLDTKYIEHRRQYASKHNKLPEVREHRKQQQRTHRAKPEIKKRNAEYNKKHRSENRKHYNAQVRLWNKNNPEKQLMYSKRHLDKLGIPFKLPSRRYGMALESWSKTVRSQLGEKCWCGDNDNVQSHHIFHKAKYPKLSLNPNNGIPLCKKHHLEVHGKMLVLRH